MQAVDKLKRDLDGWFTRQGGAPDSKAYDALRTLYKRALGDIPESTVAAVYTTFLSFFASSGDRSGQKAIDWLGGLGSLLLMDYDGTEFTRAEWVEIREIVTLDSGDIDMDILSYVLTQVLDHGGI